MCRRGPHIVERAVCVKSMRKRSAERASLFRSDGETNLESRRTQTSRDLGLFIRGIRVGMKPVAQCGEIVPQAHELFEG
jgi:hypothetical protein